VTLNAIKVSKRQADNGGKTAEQVVMKLETRVFDLYQERYGNLTAMAGAMGISVSQVYRVRQGKRPISEKFITGTVRAFPEYRLDDLFHVVPSGKHYDGR
jgi:hypothetical protein